MQLQLKKMYSSMNGEDVWSIIVQLIEKTKLFKSVTMIEYEAKITETGIFYKGGEGNRGCKGEEISKIDFVKAFDIIKSLDVINTYKIKNKIPNKLYMKRTPFIGLLFSADILEIKKRK